jgi:hypothetical protein
MKIDNRIKGEESEQALLKSLHKFGWLTAKMAAAMHWNHVSSGEALARRVLLRLLDEKLVLRKTADGNTLWLLSAAGARMLREQYNIDAVSGQNLKLANLKHRACINWFSIFKQQAGFGITTEYEIQTGRAPWGKLGEKVADGMLDSGQGLIWVECENAWKNRARRQEISHLCRLHLAQDGGRMTPLSGEHYLARLEVIGTNETALRLMEQTFREAYESGDLRDAHMSNVTFTLLPISESLSAGPMRSQELWGDIVWQGLST